MKGGCTAKKVICLTQMLLCTFSVTQFFLLGFLWSSDNVTAINKKTHPRAYQCIWDNYIANFCTKNIIISLLFQYGLLIHTYVSKIANASKDTIFYLHWHNVIRWSNHIYKKSSFLSFHSLLFLVNNAGRWWVKLTKCDPG